MTQYKQIVSFVKKYNEIPTHKKGITHPALYYDEINKVEKVHI